jgi:hypothetical protein
MLIRGVEAALTHQNAVSILPHEKAQLARFSLIKTQAKEACKPRSVCYNVV